MHYGAGESPGDTRYALDLGYDQTAKVIHVVGFSAHDHVVGAGDVVSLRDATDSADGHSYIGSLADFGLDEDISLNHSGLPVVCVRHAIAAGYRQYGRPSLNGSPRRSLSPSRNLASSA